MLTRIRFGVVFILCVLIFTLACADPFFAEPQAAAENKAAYGPHEDEIVFRSVINSFGLLAGLMQDVSYARDSVYPTVNKADNIEDAIAYLSPGFQSELAASIANYYFGWDEDAARLVLIPTESIPIITAADRDVTQITFIDEHHAVLECIYDNCYARQDRYLYSIYVDKSEESEWKISELSFEEINNVSE